VHIWWQHTPRWSDCLFSGRNINDRFWHVSACGESLRYLIRALLLQFWGCVSNSLHDPSKVPHSFFGHKNRTSQNLCMVHHNVFAMCQWRLFFVQAIVLAAKQ